MYINTNKELNSFNLVNKESLSLSVYFEGKRYKSVGRYEVPEEDAKAQISHKVLGWFLTIITLGFAQLNHTVKAWTQGKKIEVVYLLQKTPTSSKTDVQAKRKLKLSPSMELELDQKLTSIPIEDTNPFHDTDLVVFEDGYKGPMPLNGIMEKEFLEITELYENIKKGKSHLNIEGSEDFKNGILDDIKKLLTRNIGRKIFGNINSEIKIQEGAEGLCSRERVITLSNDISEGQFDLGHDNRGKPILIKLEKYIILGHELIHALHFQDESVTVDLTPTLGDELHNLEEQSTILGLDNYLKMISPSPEEELVDEESFEREFILSEKEIEQFKYDEINEVNLCAEFGHAIRDTHLAITKPDLKLTSNVASSEITKFLVTVAEFGLLIELEEFIQVNGNISKIISSKNEPLIQKVMADAINFDQIEIFKKLSSLPNAPTFSFMEILRKGAVNIALYQTDKLRNLSQSEKDTALLHFLSKTQIPLDESQRKLLKTLLDQGARIDPAIIENVTEKGTIPLEEANELLKDDKNFVISCILQQKGIIYLKHVSERLKNDRDVVLAAVIKDGVSLKDASVDLRHDKNIVMEAVTKNWKALEYASDALKKDKEIVLAAVKQDWNAFHHADKALLNDKDIMLALVRNRGEFLKEASVALKNDKEIVLTAVRNNGNVLEYASKALKNDKEVVIAAVSQSGIALEYASDALKKDKEVVYAAATKTILALELAHKSHKKFYQNNKKFVLEAIQRGDKEALQFASNALKNDREVVLAAVKQNGATLQFASEGLKKDKVFVMEAVKQNAEAFFYANRELKKDKDLLLLYVKENGKELPNLTIHNRAIIQDRDIVLAAVKNYGQALREASEDLKDDREIVLAAVKQDWQAILYASDRLQKDKDVLLAAIKNNGYALQVASEDLKNDRDFVLQAVKLSGIALNFAGRELKDDAEIVLEAIKKDKTVVDSFQKAFKYASARLKGDKVFILSAIKENPLSLEFASPALRDDRDVVLAAIKQNPLALQYASETLKRDRNLVLEAIKLNWRSLKYADQTLQNDKEVVIAAVRKHRDALEYASKARKLDGDVLREAFGPKRTKPKPVNMPPF